MRDVVKPLGGLVTRLPVGSGAPRSDRRAPRSSCSTAPTTCSPIATPRGRSWRSGCAILAELATRCREVCSPLHLPTLTKITDALVALADELAAAR